MNTVKEKIHQKCLELVEQKIAVHQKAMKDAQNAANKEQRSTAGDKYDTSRAMSQNERDMYARQLAESLQMKKTLSTIDPGKASKKAISGSLVITAKGNYYLSVSCGKIVSEGKDYFAISPITPVGQMLLNKKAGDTFEMKEETISITEIS